MDDPRRAGTWTARSLRRLAEPLSARIGWRHPGSPLVVAGVVALLLVVSTLGPSDASGAVRTVAAWLALFFIPGALLAFSIIKREIELGELIPLAFGLGLVLFCAFGVVAFLFQLPLFAGAAFCLICTFGLLAWLNVRDSRTTLVVQQGWTWVLMLVALVFAVILFRVGSIQGGDSLSHLTWIRRLVDRSTADPSVVAPTPNGPLWAPYAYNTWYLAVATITHWTGVDLVTVWLNVASLAVIPFTLAVWLLAKQLFGNTRVALVAGLAYIGQMGVLTGLWAWRLAPYPDQIAKFLLAIALALLLEYRRTSRLAVLGIVVLTGASLQLIHISSFLLFCLFGGSFGIALWLGRLRDGAKRIAAAVVGTLLLAAPMLALKICLIYSIPQDFQQQGFVAGIFDPWRYIEIVRGWFIVRWPSRTAEGLLDVFGFMGIGLMPFLLATWLRRKVEWALLVLAGVLGVILLVFNPLLATPAIHLLSGNVVRRAVYGFKFLGLFAFSYYVSLLRGHVATVTRRLRYGLVIGGGFLAVVALILLVAPRIPEYPDKYQIAKVVGSEQRAGELVEAADELRFIGDATEDRSVILAGDKVLVPLGPYFDRYLLPPRLGDLVLLNEALEDGLAPRAEIMGVIEAYGVDYVFAQTEEECRAFDGRPDAFERVASMGSRCLYRVIRL